MMFIYIPHSIQFQLNSAIESLVRGNRTYNFCSMNETLLQRPQTT